MGHESPRSSRKRVRRLSVSQEVIRLRRGLCGTCKVPSVWANCYTADGDNTSIRRSTATRGAFYEVGEIDNLIIELSSRLRTSLDSLSQVSMEDTSRRFFQSVASSPYAKLAKVLSPLSFYRENDRLSALLGEGTAEIRSYRRGGPLVVEAKNPWSGSLFASGLAGMFEAVEGETCGVTVDGEGDNLVFTVRKRGVPAREADSPVVPLDGVLSGTIEHPQCYKCGAPASLKAFEWDQSAGVILERDTGTRVVYQSVAFVDTLILAVAGMHGEESRDVAVRVHGDYVRESIESGPSGEIGRLAEPKERYLHLLGLIRRRCLGNPFDTIVTEESVTARVRNPANIELVQGRVLGTFEALSGISGRVESDRSEGVLRIRAFPA